MNDIIKKLKTQATEDIMGVPVLNAELFAELIVLECAGLFPAEYDTVEGKTTIGKIIKKHFGVE